jgi:hypothetical protein
VGPRAGLDGCGKVAPQTGIRFPNRSARSESVYRLSYPSPPGNMKLYLQEEHSMPKRSQVN